MERVDRWTEVGGGDCVESSPRQSSAPVEARLPTEGETTALEYVALTGKQASEAFDRTFGDVHVRDDERLTELSVDDGSLYLDRVLRPVKPPGALRVADGVLSLHATHTRVPVRLELRASSHATLLVMTTLAPWVREHPAAMSAQVRLERAAAPLLRTVRREMEQWARVADEAA